MTRPLRKLTSASTTVGQAEVVQWEFAQDIDLVASSVTTAEQRLGFGSALVSVRLGERQVSGTTVMVGEVDAAVLFHEHRE
jgi:hypothetical protein